MVKAFVDAKKAYTRGKRESEAATVVKDLNSFQQATWDPRSSLVVDYDKLVVQSDIHLILEHNRAGSYKRDLNASAKVNITDGKAFINALDEHTYVIITHQFDRVKPATLDFGAITIDKVGTLKLLAHGYPRTNGGKIVVKVGERIIWEPITISADGWQAIPVPFQRNRVVIEHYAVDWSMEFMFFAYEITIDSTPPRNPRSKRR